jgi:hypothetical protein
MLVSKSFAKISSVALLSPSRRPFVTLRLTRQMSMKSFWSVVQREEALKNQEWWDAMEEMTRIFRMICL